MVLTAAADRLHVPYPSLLAIAGAGIAFLPFAPNIRIEPDLALALFVAPALLDAAFDTSPQELRRNVIPVVSLAVFAVALTTATVAFVGWRFAGLPIAAAIALGAIVAPPDAAAAAAVLKELRLPQRIGAVLQGESLLNDATALLIYRAAVAMAVGSFPLASDGPLILLSAAGSLIAGYVLARLYLVLTSRIRDAASSTVLQFVGTFAVWLLAERLTLSPIITVVIYAMALAQAVPRKVGEVGQVEHRYSSCTCGGRSAITGWSLGMSPSWRRRRAAEVVEELDVGLVVVGPLLGDVVLVVDGLHGADRLAGTAVDALVGVDVEPALALVDAVDRALLDAGLVLEVDTGLRDHVRHGAHTMRAMDAPEVGSGRDPRVGSRVVVRHRLGAPDPLTGATLTDAVGELVSDDDGILVVRTRRGEVRVPRPEVTALKEVPPSPSGGASRTAPCRSRTSARHGRRVAGDGDRAARRLGAAGVARLHPAGQLGDDGRQPRHPAAGCPRHRRAVVCRARLWRRTSPSPGRCGFDAAGDAVGAEALRRGYVARVATLTLTAPTRPHRDPPPGAARRCGNPQEVEVAGELTEAWFAAYRAYRPVDDEAARAILTGSPGQAFATVRDDDGASSASVGSACRRPGAASPRCGSTRRPAAVASPPRCSPRSRAPPGGPVPRRCTCRPTPTTRRRWRSTSGTASSGTTPTSTCARPLRAGTSPVATAWGWCR